MIKHPIFLIIDGMSQAYRAYFATPPLSTTQGIPTNATYVFATMLKRVLEKFPPEYIAVALDSSAPTQRHAQYEAYKATRKKMPPDLAQQIPYIRRFCDAMRIPVLAIPGYEADDIIATVAARAVAAGLYPLVVTIDKDLYQIVDTTLILNTSKEDLVVDRDKVKELFGVPPEQIPDLLGLMGDSSDNVPGAPGIGPKTAQDLIQRFGSLEACLERAGEIKSAKQRASLQDHRDQILLSKKLVTIDCNVPLDLEWQDFAVKEPDRAALIPLLRELEFNALIKDYVSEGTAPQTEVVLQDEIPVVGDSVCIDIQNDRLSIWTGSGSIASIPLDARAASLLANPALRKVVYDVKHTVLQLQKRGLDLAPPYEDVLLMAFLLFPNRSRYELSELMFDIFGQTAAGDRTPWIQKVYENLQPQIEKELPEVYRKIELPLASVLAGMEQTGIRIDPKILHSMSAEMTAQIEELTRRIYAAAECEFNLNSPKQLGEILFEKMNLPMPRKLKKSGQYSTAVEVLEELARTYPLPGLILEYRQFAKFKSTYVDVIPQLMDPVSSRLHTSFNQTGAATGRLSSSNPNLQNIPVRTELGRKIRGAFIPEPGWWFVSADYSQVELRIVAHLSGDPGFVEAFLAGEDIHRRTAAEVLGIPLDLVSAEQRDRAKAVNFGIVYGQTPYGLAQQLGISNDEAAEFIARYFARYRGVQQYMADCLSTARDTGVTRTLFGRLRQHPEINSKNGMRRSMAERTAINSPIQGTAADIIKLAMIRIADDLRRDNLRTRMVLQVHDELIFEVPEDELQVKDRIRQQMQDVVRLSVPLTVNLKQGRDWQNLISQAAV
jgi:DNA polymerase-1